MTDICEKSGISKNTLVPNNLKEVRESMGSAIEILWNQVSSFGVDQEEQNQPATKDGAATYPNTAPVFAVV